MVPQTNMQAVDPDVRVNEQYEELRRNASPRRQSGIPGTRTSRSKHWIRNRNRRLRRQAEQMVFPDGRPVDPLANNPNARQCYACRRMALLANLKKPCIACEVYWHYRCLCTYIIDSKDGPCPGCFTSQLQHQWIIRYVSFWNDVIWRDIAWYSCSMGSAIACPFILKYLLAHINHFFWETRLKGGQILFIAFDIFIMLLITVWLLFTAFRVVGDFMVHLTRRQWELIIFQNFDGTHEVNGAEYQFKPQDLDRRRGAR